MIKANDTKGITLIALVVTIVVLLILAAVTISLVFGPNGVINKAKEADENTKIAQVREQLELAKGPEYIEGNGKYDPDSYFQRIEDEDIINDKEKDVIDNGDGTYEITTTPGYIFIITLVPSKDNVEDIEIDYDGKVDEPRIKSLSVSGKTTSSITVEVDTTNAEGGTYTYYYKKEVETEWIKAGESEENTYTFNGLEANVLYNIKVEVEKDGKKANKETSTMTGELPEGAVQFSPIEWSAGQASTVITTNETDYTLQYQIGGIEEEKWIDTTSGTTIGNLQHGTTVYGRLFDGTNGSKTANINIEDEIDPTISDFKVTTFDVSSITVKADAVDDQSGIAKYQFEYKLTIATDYEVASTVETKETSYTYQYTGLADETSYDVKVTVFDKAGNEVTSAVITQATKQANVAPSTPTTTFSSKTTNSITVTANATDSNGDKITYKLYTSTSENSGFTEKATSSSTASGSQVTLQATGLSQYTTYYYYVTATDGIETATSATGSVRTYCPGTGLTCNGPFTTTTTCSSCGGEGTKTCGARLKYAGKRRTNRNIETACYACGGIMTNNMYKLEGYCPECGAEYNMLGHNAWYHSSCCNDATASRFSCGNTSARCNTCNGTGQVTTNISCSHGKTSTHSYCTHNQTSQHD